MLHFTPIRQRRLCSSTGHRNSSTAIGKLYRLHDALTLGQCNTHGTTKCISRSSRIDSLDPHTRNLMIGSFLSYKCTFSAKRYHHIIHALAANNVCSTRHTIHIGNLRTRDEFRLSLIGNKHIKISKQAFREMTSRSRVEYHFLSLIPSQTSHMNNGIKRRLQLHKHNVNSCEQVLSLIHISRTKMRIGS